jgi:hypothetical protein
MAMMGSTAANSRLTPPHYDPTHTRAHTHLAALRCCALRWCECDATGSIKGSNRILLLLVILVQQAAHLLYVLRQ